jgi:beta-galactosidase
MVLALSSQALSQESLYVDFLDYARFASAWRTTLGEPDFNENYDFDDDDDVDITDLYFFTKDWLSPQTNREKLSFNTGWKFYKGTVSGDDAKNPGYDDSSWLAVNIPHNPPMTGQSGPDPLRPPWSSGYSYEGVSWYRKHFTIGDCYQGKKIFIEFEAINTRADVWVNGTLIPTTPHYGGYLPFTVDITDYANFGPTENVIAVKADNTDDPDTPIGNSTWFNWGGIYRDTWLHISDKLHITDAVYADIVAGGGIFVTYPSVSASEAEVQVKTHIKNEYTTTKNCTVKTYIVDANDQVVNTTEMSSSESIAAGADYTFTQSTTVNDPCLWHPDHPYLYTVLTEVYDADSLVDTYQTRIGIRSISFSKAEGFKINGQVLRFRGTNRLQDYPYIGYAMGNIGQRRDAEKLKEAGFEFVRTSHYPQDPAFMEACDELGIMIMDEIPGCFVVGGATFRSRSYQNMRDMIRRDRNHPCVIAWELSLNETGFDSGYATNAVNIGHAEYPGSYISGWLSAYNYDIYIATPTAGARSYSGSKPLIIDEYGHWEYNYNGYSDVHRGYVGDGYNYGETAMLNQIVNHQDGLNLNRGMTYLCGDALWVGIDYGPYPSGVLDPFRLPKFSYYFFQSQRDPDVNIPGIDSGPMVFIANYWTASSPTTVKVFSNCDQVKLYKNDVLQDTRSPDTGGSNTNLQHPPFTFTGLSFTSGELKAEGLIDGEVVATHIVNTPGSADSLSVEFDVTNVPANGSEIIFVYASIVDSASTVVPDASNEVTFSVSGQATLASPATVDAEAGIATALIRVTDQPGLITVTATASGLTTDDASITSE